MKPTVACRMAASGDPGGIAAVTSKAHPNGKATQPTATAPVAGSIGASAVNGPGRAPASCRSWIAYASTPAATSTRKAPVQAKNTRRSMRTMPRASAQPRATDVRSPNSAPRTADGASPKDCTIDHSSSVVSMPSRATETKPIATIAQAPPTVSARSMPPSSERFMVRAVFCIQKIIQVTIATVRRDSSPPMSSCASNVRAYAPKVRIAPMPSASAIARAMPVHSRGSTSRRPMRLR